VIKEFPLIKALQRVKLVPKVGGLGFWIPCLEVYTFQTEFFKRLVNGIDYSFNPLWAFLIPGI